MSMILCLDDFTSSLSDSLQILCENGYMVLSVVDARAALELASEKVFGRSGPQLSSRARYLDLCDSLEIFTAQCSSCHVLRLLRHSLSSAGGCRCMFSEGREHRSVFDHTEIGTVPT